MDIFSTRSIWRACTVTTLMVTLGGCMAALTAPEDLKLETRTSRLDQVMRVADSTRSGGDLTSALSIYQRAHKIDDSAEAPLTAIGETAYDLGRNPDAARAYAKLINLYPANPDARHGYGKVLIAMNRPRLAAEQFRAAITLRPKNHRSHNGLGVARDMEGQHDQAQQHYINGMEIEPDSMALRNNLALSLALSGSYEEARQILAEIAENPLATARVRQNLALIYGLAGDMESAAIVASQDLNQAQIQNNLAYYKVLRTMSGTNRVKAILGHRGNSDVDILPATPPVPSQPVTQ